MPQTFSIQIQNGTTGEWITLPTPPQLENFTIEPTLTGFVVELVDPDLEPLTVTPDTKP